MIFNTTAFNTIQESGSGILTLGSGILIATGTGGGTIGSSVAGTATINNGTISAQTSAKTITLAGTFTNNGTVEASNGGTVALATTSTSLTNLSNATLTGGQWDAFAGSTINLGSTSITNNAANVLLSGQGSTFAAINSLAINSGTFTITAGRNFTASSLSNSGDLNIGAGSELFAASLSQASTGTLGISLAATTDNQFGQVDISGSASLEGTLSLSFVDGYVPEFDDNFDILSANSITGAFSSLSQPTLGQGYFQVTYTPQNVFITFVPEPATAAILLPTTLLLRSRRRRRCKDRPCRRGRIACGVARAAERAAVWPAHEMRQQFMTKSVQAVWVKSTLPLT